MTNPSSVDTLALKTDAGAEVLAQNGDDTGGPDGDDSDDGTALNAYKPTTTPESELLLAKSLGYPSGWRVVRTVPHPALLDVPKSEVTSLVSHKTDQARSRIFTHFDVIYTSSDGAADWYYNHSSAMQAALDFVDDKYTGFGGKGHGLKEQPLYVKDDLVNVQFEGTWYAAVCTGFKRYDDEIRYSVLYKVDGAHQTNISKELMMKATQKSQKRLIASTSSPKKSTKKSTSSAKKKTNSKFKSSFLRTLSNKEIKLLAANGKKHGFPKGWLLNEKKDNRYSIWSPCGSQSYRSKTAAFEAAGVTNGGVVGIASGIESEIEESDKDVKPPPKKARNSPKPKAKQVTPKLKDNISKTKVDPEPPTSSKKKRGRPRKRKVGDVEATEINPQNSTEIRQKEDIFPNDAKLDDDDPPWRESGNKYLGQRILHKYVDEEGDQRTQEGVVGCWLSANDVDSQGEPAYASEKTGLPTELFRVHFDAKEEGDIMFVDLEDFELEDQLI